MQHVLSLIIHHLAAKYSSVHGIFVLVTLVFILVVLCKFSIVNLFKHRLAATKRTHIYTHLRTQRQRQRQEVGGSRRWEVGGGRQEVGGRRWKVDLSIYICMYIYVCMYVYIYIYIYTHIIISYNIILCYIIVHYIIYRQTYA